MSITAGKCIVCDPIQKIVEHLKLNGAIVRSSICGDIHFNEVRVEVSGGKALNAEVARNVNGISYDTRGFLYCTCHWSTIKRL